MAILFLAMWGNTSVILNGGEWETSGIVDVSSLFGEEAGSVFLFDVQAHGLADQDDVNLEQGDQSALTDDNLAEGGQLVLLTNSELLQIGGVSEGQGEGGGIGISTVGDAPTVTFDSEDNLKGTLEDESIRGLGGGDTINGRAGDDRLFGGTGDDTIFGRRGDDFISGSSGNDELIGNVGDDTLDGGEGDDTLLGGRGDDVLIGGGGFDVLTGFREEDTFVLGDESGTFYAEAGDADLAEITDFETGVDTIQLAGGIGDYTLVGPMGAFTEIRFAANDDLIATVANGFAESDLAFV